MVAKVNVKCNFCKNMDSFDLQLPCTISDKWLTHTCLNCGQIISSKLSYLIKRI